MKDDSRAQTEVVLRRALAPILHDSQEVSGEIVRGAVRRGRRRRQLRRAGVALAPLVVAAAVAVTVVSIRFSTTSSDSQPTDTTRALVWQSGAESPLSPRGNATVVQVGREVVVLGGSDADPCPPNAFCTPSQEDDLKDGAVYEPDRDAWRSIAPAPIGLMNISATVSGTSVYVLTHPWSESGQAQQQLWEYSLADDRWSELPAPPRRMDTVVAAGADRLVASVSAHLKTWTADQSYDIASQTWSPMPRDPLAPSEDRNLVATESGDLVLIAVDRHVREGKPLWAPWRTARWDAATGTWKEVSTPSIVDSEPIWRWAGDRVVNPSTQVVEVDDGSAETGGIFDPVTGKWESVPASSAGTASTYPALEAAGSGRMFVRGQLLDVQARTWLQAPRTPDAFPTQDADAIIVGDRMLVFGGATISDSSFGQGTLSNDMWVLRLPPTNPATS